MTSTSRLAAGLAVSLAFAALVGWGCGEPGDTDPTPVQTFKITPAANASLSPVAGAPTSSPTVSPPGTPGGAGTISIGGISTEFDVEEIEAPAGSITIEFDNRDGGVVHNIHFFRGDDADGESVAQTELDVGPTRQALTFDVQPGEYFYQCDAHPNTMRGTLKVAE